MSNFWNNIGQNKNNGFNTQQFLQFLNNCKGQNPNVMLQQLLSSGKFSQDEINEASNQANGVYEMLKSFGILK